MGEEKPHRCERCKGAALVWVSTSNCGHGGALIPCPNSGVTSDSARLAGEIQATQFALDDLATDVGGDRDDSPALLELADRLEKLAGVLRVRAADRSPVLEQS